AVAKGECRSLSNCEGGVQVRRGSAGAWAVAKGECRGLDGRGGVRHGWGSAAEGGAQRLEVAPAAQSGGVGAEVPLRDGLLDGRPDRLDVALEGAQLPFV